MTSDEGCWPWKQKNEGLWVDLTCLEGENFGARSNYPREKRSKHDRSFMANLKLNGPIVKIQTRQSAIHLGGIYMSVGDV